MLRQSNEPTPYNLSFHREVIVATNIITASSTGHARLSEKCIVHGLYTEQSRAFRS